MANTDTGIPTPLEALTALHAACERSLDPELRYSRVMANAYTAIANAQPVECSCWGGFCRREVVNGRCANGDRCKAHLAETLSADGGPL
jgi:hypothetical protein